MRQRSPCRRPQPAADHIIRTSRPKRHAMMPITALTIAAVALAVIFGTADAARRLSHDGKRAHKDQGDDSRRQAPEYKSQDQQLWHFPDDFIMRASVMNQTRAADLLPAPPVAENSTKMVVRAMNGPDDSNSDVGKGWLVYSRAPQPMSPLNLYSTVRLDLEGMDAMVINKGYPLERHITVTGDGYRLVTFRIPYGRSGPTGPARPGNGAPRQPVLLLHGISLASTCWVVNEPDESLAFILADLGYDVFMMNTRGNTFSREHEKYTTSDSRFWRFSMDELAQDDLPAVLAYVKMVTGADKVHMVGHSQGGTIALAMLARMPEQAANVGILVALGPVVYVKYLESFTMRTFCAQANSSLVLNALPPQEFLFMGRSTQMLFLNGLCQTPGATQACVAATESLFGPSNHISTLQYRRYWQAWPSATSYWNALQWSQMFNEPQPRFMQFNWGPEYDITQVKAPVIMVSGGIDVLSTDRDVSLVSQRLTQSGALRGTSHIEDYGHMDFIWDTDAKNRVYPVVTNALDRYTEAEGS